MSTRPTDVASLAGIARWRPAGCRSRPRAPQPGRLAEDVVNRVCESGKAATTLANSPATLARPATAPTVPRTTHRGSGTGDVVAVCSLMTSWRNASTALVGLHCPPPSEEAGQPGWRLRGWAFAVAAAIQADGSDGGGGAGDGQGNALQLVLTISLCLIVGFSGLATSAGVLHLRCSALRRRPAVRALPVPMAVGTVQSQLSASDLVTARPRPRVRAGAECSMRMDWSRPPHEPLVAAVSIRSATTSPAASSAA